MTRTLHKTGLVVGYLGLLAAVVVSHRTPTTGYELSIYRATPQLVWAGIGVALLTAVPVLVAAPRATRTHDAAALLTASTALAVITLPIVRGYYFYGGGDSLSHIGWAREIASGSLSATNLLYPGIHTATVLLSRLADVSLTQANLYIVLLLFPLCFFLFVPLAVQLLADTPKSYAVGLLAALLMTPVNNIAVHLIAHPASQAILFSPVLFYLALAYAVRDTDSTGWLPRPSNTTGLGVLLAGFSVAFLLVHPQQELNLALCLLAVVGLQTVARYRGNETVVDHRFLHVQAFVLVAAFLAWAPRFDRVSGAVSSTITSIVTQGATAGNVVSQKSVSLTTLGGSIFLLFVKLFIGALVVSLLAAVVIVLALRGRFGDRDANTLVGYLTAALVPVTGVFLLVLASSAGDMYFRYEGFIMVPVTVLGAVAVALAIDRARGRGRTVAKTAIVVLFLVLVPAGLAATHPAPYIYQPSRQVTESVAHGYGNSFETRVRGVEFAGVRGGPRRFVDFYYGTQQARTTLDFPGYEDPIPTAVFSRGNFTDYYEDPRYLGITESDYAREVELYEGFRYPASGFQALDATVGVNRVRASEGYALYYIAGEE
jgi:hypothetical protein